MRCTKCLFSKQIVQLCNSDCCFIFCPHNDELCLTYKLFVLMTYFLLIRSFFEDNKKKGKSLTQVSQSQVYRENGSWTTSCLQPDISPFNSQENLWLPKISPIIIPQNLLRTKIKECHLYQWDYIIELVNIFLVNLWTNRQMSNSWIHNF